MKNIVLIVVVFASFALPCTLYSFDPYAPSPEPEPTPAPTPSLNMGSITTVLPDGVVQIAPSSYFTPKIIYTGQTTATGFKKVKQTTGNKYDTTFANKYLAKTAGANVASKNVHHPRAGALGIPASFDAFLNQLEAEPQFLPFFQKLKVFIMHDIYVHLLKVYTNFNMQHPKTLADYITYEETYGLNKKTLVVNHLVNIIEAQTNGQMMQMFPSIQQDKVSWVGNFLMQHETADINTFILSEEDNFYLSTADQQTVSKSKQKFFGILTQYFQFFNQYTVLLDTPDPTTGMNTLVSAARKVAQEINNFNAPLRNALAQAAGKTVGKTVQLKKNGVTTNKTFQLNAQTQVLRTAKTNGSYLNPGIFFYDEETFRGIKLIPYLAEKIGAGNYQKVGWPAQIIDDAKKGTPAQYDISAIVGITQVRQQDYPIAYFKDQNGTQTKVDAGATGLFVNMPNGTSSYTKYDPVSKRPQQTRMTSLHEQELLQEPEWLSTQAGILKILKACLGDFSQILGMGILNPCNEAIILKAVNPGTDPAALPGWPACQAYLAIIEKTRKAYASNNPPPS